MNTKKNPRKTLSYPTFCTPMSSLHFVKKCFREAGYIYCSGMTGRTDKIVLVVIGKMNEAPCLSIDRPEETKQV